MVQPSFYVKLNYMRHRMSNVEAEMLIQATLPNFDPRALARAYEKDLHQKYYGQTKGFIFGCRDIKATLNLEGIVFAIEDCSTLHKDLKLKSKVEGMFTMQTVEGGRNVIKIVASNKLNEKQQLWVLKYFFACYMYILENPHLINEHGFFYLLVYKNLEVSGTDDNLNRFARYFASESTYFW